MKMTTIEGEVTPLGSVEQELDRAAISPVLRVLYAMLHNQVMTLGRLRKLGCWKDDPAELESALRRDVLARDSKGRTTQHNLRDLAFERELWPSTTRLLEAIHNEGGPRIPLRMVVNGAKRMSKAGRTGTIPMSEEEKKRRASAQAREYYRRKKQLKKENRETLRPR